jgi:hypothetical protein
MRIVGRLLLALAMLLLLVEAAFSDQQREWQTGKITRAEEPKRRKPEHEVWNPWLAHWYTIETKSELIRATEMVPARVKREPLGVDREPPMSFGMGQEVRVSLQTPPPTDRGKPRELYVRDRKGKEHVLTVDQIVPRNRQ